MTTMQATLQRLPTLSAKFSRWLNRVLPSMLSYLSITTTSTTTRSQRPLPTATATSSSPQVRLGCSPVAPKLSSAVLLPGWSFTRYNYSRTFGPNALCAQDNKIHQPTANYVEYYGMENGLPLDDPDSGYDPNYPFRAGRDPRFYHDIIFDGVQYINGDPGADAAMKYAGLATGGSMRAVSNASRTGYFYQKLVPHTCQKIDQGSADDYGPNPHAYIPYMRLADIYLMYAEACAVKGGPAGKSDKCSLTSIDALNKLRDRVGAGHVSTKFTGNAYMDEVRRERAVELAFEGTPLQRPPALAAPHRAQVHR